MAPPRRSRRLALKRVGVGDLPTNVLTHVLLSATTHDDLLVHVANCARVHPEWRRAVMGSAAFGRDIVGTSGIPQMIAANLTGTESSAAARSRVLRTLSAALRQAKADGELGLTASWMADQGARALDAAVRALPTPLALTKLDVGQCLLSAAGAKIIAALLRDGRFGFGLETLILTLNTKVQELPPIKHRLSDGVQAALRAHGPGALGDAGMVALASVLPTQPRLCRLEFGAVGCGDRGMSAVAAALPATQCGTIVCPLNPAVSEKGWAALGAALPRAGEGPPEVEGVVCAVAGAKLSGAGAVKALTDGLATSHKTALMLFQCEIGDAGAVALAGLLPRSKLRSLGVWNPDPDPTGSFRSTGVNVALAYPSHGIGVQGRAALEAAAAQIPGFSLSLPEPEDEAA